MLPSQRDGSLVYWLLWFTFLFDQALQINRTGTSKSSHGTPSVLQGWSSQSIASGLWPRWHPQLHITSLFHARMIPIIGLQLLSDNYFSCFSVLFALEYRPRHPFLRFKPRAAWTNLWDITKCRLYHWVNYPLTLFVKV